MIRFSSRRSLLRALIAIAAMFVIAACARRAPNATPEGAVRELVERLDRSNGDVGDAKAAFELLSKRARANLTARAQRYADASGKPIPPEAMIAPARFVLYFEPSRYTAQISGSQALVEVSGALPSEKAIVPCVFEDNAWRVDLNLPALPQVQVRPGSTP